MKIFKSILGAAAFLAVSVPSGFAGTVSYNSGTFGAPSFASAFTGANLSLQQFDSSIGTLTGVILTLHGTVTGDITLDSFDTQAATATSDLKMTIDLKLPGSVCTTGCTVVTVLPDYHSVDLMDASPDGGDTPSEISHLGVTDSKTNSSSSLTDQAILDFFTGLSSVNLNLAAAANSSSSSTGTGFAPTLITKGTASASVEYTYATNTSTTPEPASLFLFGGALVGLGLARRTSLFSK